MIKVLLADDHALVREGIKLILSEISDIEVVAEARNGTEVVSLLFDKKVDIVVLDLSMPNMDGLDTLKQVKEFHPNLPVLILSMYPEEQYAIRVLRNGAAGYLTKDTAGRELVNAIRKVLNGGKYITPSIAEQMAMELSLMGKNNGEELPHKLLSDREYQILCLIASGKAPKEIADELHISTKTVSTYRSRLLEKMEMKSNSELTHYAIKNSLIG